MKKTIAFVFAVIAFAIVITSCTGKIAVDTPTIRAEETEKSTDNQTEESEPPFFSKEYQIDDKNSMTLMAGYSDGGILVSVDCQIDGSDEPHGSIVYCDVLMYSRSLAERIDSLVLTSTDTSNNEISYTMFTNGQTMLSNHPSYFRADVLDDNELDVDKTIAVYETIGSAFEDLEAAINEN
ncbi:MAG: hypothetical protein IJH07_05515 [Ruminococcus sp.]|nr:hypothetical protein [Ruminococcus sp.]